ncbi:M28 family peptidase [Sporosarcina sp. ACRSL]|uniref:M28 family metallopeptidase n=1 Tax=Sporosarcina sp. ACRSL TaxID=2918215 RepID=UPI001EF63E5A|nr:M28 family metallopeptidase [Sporosarcina sp. ACRSL]MCG7342546.1 M28 family peptidase [Sporosarcina sp. ACRSL]
MQTIKERLMNHVKVLSNEIGCRPVGTQANSAASAYIEKVFRDSGLEVELQEFEVPVWQLNEAFIEFNSERLEARGNSFTEACEVSGEIIPFCTMEELASSSNLEGKIAFLYGELSKENYVPKSFTIYNPDHHKKTIQLFEEKKPSAIIFVRMETEKNLPIINDWDFSIPSLTVTPEVGLKIIDNHHDSSAVCTINSTSSRGSTKNIIGRMQGDGEEKIILVAHYDTVFETNGAYDNASGIALLLSLAEELANGKNRKNGFEFIAFSSEEFLALGDEYYLKEHKGNLQNIIVAMNFDGVGQSLGTNNITLMSGSKELEADLREIKRAFPSVHWTSPWYESNHYTFFSNGVPSIPFSSTGVSDLLHTKEDTDRWLSKDKLYEVYLLAFEIIKSLQGKTSKWTRDS